MSGDEDVSVANSTVAKLGALFTFALSVVTEAFGEVKDVAIPNIWEFLVTKWQGILWCLGVTTVQTQVLQAFIFILIVNLTLIRISWSVYSCRIATTLSSNSLLRVEEILKKSTSLKLNKETTPRI